MEKVDNEKLLAIANEIADKAVKEILHELPPGLQGTAVTYIYTKMHDHYKQCVAEAENTSNDQHARYNSFREGDKIPAIIKD